MNVSLTPELAEFVEKLVKTGTYHSPSEVMRAGLRLLQAEKEPKPRFMVSSIGELEAKLLIGTRQLDGGEGILGRVAAKELSDRAKTRRKRNG